MPLILFSSIILTLCYCLLMALYMRGWTRQKEFILPAHFLPDTFISVVIPARNEQNNIGACINAILAQQYPHELFEIIVVDDHSDDDTAGIVSAYHNPRVRLIRLRDHLDGNQQIVAYKKAAIAAGIAESRGSLIVTTDADCTAPDTWLMHIAAIYERDNPSMIVAPVIFSADRSMVQVFQLIDFMSMQGITAAAHQLGLGNMSNGANLAFSRAAYDRVGGYTGVDHLASGDDYLLMMKINREATGKIAYLKGIEAIVTTAPQPGWRSFLQQRIRWASKSGKYNDVRLTGILVLVYLFNLSFLVLLVAGIFHPALLALLALMLITKSCMEYVYLVPVARFFGKQWVLPYFFILQPVHIAYIILAGFLGFVGKYEWKGRQVR